jgi:hypothetical protein
VRRSLVAREGDAGSGGRALVAEHHLLDVDGGAPVVGDAVDAPVGHGPVAHPGVEHGADGAPELLAGILREVVECLQPARELLEGRHVELGVEPHAALDLDLRDLLLEARAGHATDHVTEHLHEPPVGVPGAAPVARALRQPLDGTVVEADVENRVHHAGHGVAGAAADGDEQRVGGVAEPAPGLRLEPADRLLDGVIEARRGDAAAAHVCHARGRADGEARRHELGAKHARHLGDVGALAAEEISHLSRALGEIVDPLGGGGGRGHRLDVRGPGGSAHPWSVRVSAP